MTYFVYCEKHKVKTVSDPIQKSEFSVGYKSKAFLSRFHTIVKYNHVDQASPS